MDLSNFEFEKCQQWLNSQERRDADKTNPDGVLNVRLHAMKHYAVMMQKAQQQAAMSQKPPSQSDGLSVAFKDLPPAGQIQAGAKVGINLTAEDVGMSAVQKAIGD